MPLLLFSAAFLLGILTADWQPLAVWFWLALVGLGLLAAFLESRLRHAPTFYSRWRGMARLPAGLLLLAFAVGGLRHTLAHPAFTPADLAWYNGQGKAQITGMVSAPPERGAESITLRVEANSLTSLSADGTPGETLTVSGLLITYLPPGGDWRYGDLLQLTGEPAAPESANSGYSTYLANQGIYTTFNQPRAVRLGRDTGSPLLAAHYSLRDTAYFRINQFLPQPESSLLAGILLGVEENIPQTVADAFRDTGTAHIIAISGFNIAILVGLFFWLFRRLLRWTWAIPATFLTIAAYSLLVGGGASVLRAAVMGGMGLLGREIGRKQSGANSLSFTAAVMVLFNPHLVWDISFQLSFAATLGLILYADPMQQAFIRLTEKRLSPGLARRLAEPVGEYFLFTLAAQVMTLPIILAHFGRLSLSALIANPIILPVQALIMILGGAAVLVGLVLAPLGQLLAWLVYPLLAFTIRAVELLARIPGGVLITGEMGAIAVLLYYTIVLVPVTRLWSSELFRKVFKPSLAIALLGITAALLWRVFFSLPDGQLHLILLDVEGGPAYLVQSPAGNYALLNGGKNADELSNALGRWLSPLDSRLDALILSRQKTDVFQGLPDTLARYPADMAAWCDPISDTSTANRLSGSLDEQNTPVTVLLPGTTLDVDSAQVSVLAANDSGCALLLTHGNLRALIPNGVPLTDLPPDALAGANLLLLSADDLKSQPLSALKSLSAPVLYAGDAALPGWVDITPYAWMKITSDGQQMWIEGGK